MAGIELSLLQRQCLGRRLGDRANLEREVVAWVAARDQAVQRIDWRFTAARSPALSGNSNSSATRVHDALTRPAPWPILASPSGRRRRGAEPTGGQRDGRDGEGGRPDP